MAPHRGIFWALVLPLAVSAYLLTGKVIAAFAKSPPAKEISELVLASWVPFCSPEPEEQITLILGLLLPVVLVFLATVALRAMGVFRSAERANPWLGLLALTTQLCMVGLAAKAILFQTESVYRYRFLSEASLTSAGVLTAIGLASANLYQRSPLRDRPLWRTLQQVRWLPLTLALSWVILYASTGIFREVDLPFNSGTFQYHLPFTMGEFAAALNGRAPLVDFFSQYQNLESLLLLPVFKLTGMGIGSFTTVMSSLTVLAFALLFVALTKVCDSAWKAFALFIPVVAVAFYAEPIMGSGFRTTVFNYFAVGPIRYLGTCIMAALAVWYLSNPTLMRLLTTGALSSAVALNNLDFGLAAATGMLACALLFPPPIAKLGLLSRIVSAACFFALSAATGLALCCLAIRLYAGAWPMLGQLTTYQKVFAYLGFFMIRMPETGLHAIIYLTVVSAVVLAVYETYSVNHAGIANKRRIINGSLAFSGIAASGPLAYYSGRSHPHVLEAAFLAWAYVLVQLFHRAWQDWEQASKRPRLSGDFLIPIPLIGLGWLLALLCPMLLEAPNPRSQILRLTARAATVQDIDAGRVTLINQYADVGDKTVIVYRDAHWLALKAGVNNLFPFAHVDSLILKEQVHAVMAALTRLPRRKQYLFGSPVPELETRLLENGYKRVNGVGDFAVWSGNSD